MQEFWLDDELTALKELSKVVKTASLEYSECAKFQEAIVSYHHRLNLILEEIASQIKHHERYYHSD